MRLKLLFLVGACVIVFSSYSQEKAALRFRIFQFSIAPSLGTNGLHPGSYANGFSINMTSGYSVANHVLELATFSNLNTSYTKGLQIAGLFNATGGNAFATMNFKEASKKIKSGFEANLEGLQVAGLSNIVITNVFGGQFTGGVNLANGALFGLQVGGIANVVKKYGFGVQLAGGYNAVVSSYDGTQVSLLFNYVGKTLQGLQVAGFNRAETIQGKNTMLESKQTAVQIGLVNRAKKMNGFQVGLVNIGGQMQGTQIGLINIYRGGKEAGTRDGTAIGLFNAGSSIELMVYADELFYTNYQLVTGTLKNGRRQDSKFIYIQNAVIFGYNPDFIKQDQTQWALGYGLYKRFFNRTTTPGMNEYRFLSGGLEVMHYNEGDELNDKLNLISRAKVSVGTRLHPKLNSIYVFGGLSYSLALSSNPLNIEPGLFNESYVSSDLARQRWAGAHLGVMIH
ncbi:MAG: hypothetical protein AAF843_20775 [Bacteroidota bacterium]